MLFLVITFGQKIKKFGIVNSFRSNFEPTLQIQNLTERTNHLDTLIAQLQDTINNNERYNIQTQSEIIDRVRAIKVITLNQ